MTAKYSMTRSTRGLSATAELLVLFVAAITDPRPGHDFGRQHQFNYDYSYWSLTVSFNQHCLMSSLLSVIRNFNIQNIFVCLMNTGQITYTGGLSVANVRGMTCVHHPPRWDSSRTD